MTQRNIDVMDILVSKMTDGDKLSKALREVYWQRNICIPYGDDSFNVPVDSLGLSNRSTNALLRTKLNTIGDVIDFCQSHKITDIRNLGRGSGIEIFETILDYSWDHMSEKERVAFLIDTVENNEDYIRE